MLLDNPMKSLRITACSPALASKTTSQTFLGPAPATGQTAPGTFPQLSELYLLYLLADVQSKYDELN
jgi:hypothetical protein